MANIWKEQKAVNEHPKRNNFDLSKKSNITMKFGGLYPVYCKRVVPGDSFSIDTAFNLKLKPVVFPVQTKMRAHMHYFYVRNKNLWSEWENWISNLTSQAEHPHPYIDLPDSEFKNGSIHDFLNVPTSIVTDNVIRNYFPFYSYYVFHGAAAPLYRNSVVGAPGVKLNDIVTDTVTSQTIVAFPIQRLNVNRVYIPTTGDLSNYLSSYFSHNNRYVTFWVSDESIDDVHYISSSYTLSSAYIYSDGVLEFSETFMETMNQLFDSYKYVVLTFSSLSTETVPAFDGYMPENYLDICFDSTVVNKGAYDYSTIGLNYYTKVQRLNALPYRAYQSIYYAYYNNGTLNPMKIGGVPQYNRYVENLGDGADNTEYKIYRRNYELDFLTSALPSPQQGVAPLVGLTALGGITIEDENGVTTCSAEYDSDGNTTGVVVTSPAASAEHARMAFNLADVGMNIHDFRNGNALLRLLETNYRKGTKYEDFIAGHYGKAPNYSTLDMPEFIGGFSRDINVSTVVSNADTLTEDSDFGAALGQYGGFAQCVGGSKSSIRHYCDDFGWIIGILSVVPTPCYSQLLPKQMLAPTNFLDYPFPEFNNVGMQPILYREVAPLQRYLDSIVDPSKSVDDTFGYQRPNYDMVSDVDEVHGEFRDSLRDWVINRIFDQSPELSQSFIEINPDEVNDIFVDTDPGADTIVGEIAFAVHPKRPFPRVVIPGLGR